MWLLNSCTVKNPSQDVFLNAVRAGEAAGVKVVVAGCVPQGQPDHKDLRNYSILGVQQIARVAEVVEETLKGHTVQLLGVDRKSAGVPLNLPKIRKNQYIEIIPINSGCLNQCTYVRSYFNPFFYPTRSRSESSLISVQDEACPRGSPELPSPGDRGPRRAGAWSRGSIVTVMARSVYGE